MGPLPHPKRQRMPRENSTRNTSPRAAPSRWWSSRRCTPFDGVIRPQCGLGLLAHRSGQTSAPTRFAGYTIR